MQIIIIRVVLNMQVRRAFIKYVSLGPFTETKPNVMERFIGTDTASVQQFTSGIETFFIPWDQLLYPLSQKSAAWDWNHL